MKLSPVIISELVLIQKNSQVREEVFMSEITKNEIRKRLGNITQLQELLFGEQVAQYDRKLDQHNQRLNKLESEFERLQLVISERFDQLENNLTQKINSTANSLARKIKYLSITTQEENSKIQQEIDVISQNNYDNINFLQNRLNSETNSLKTEIVRTKATLDRDVQLLKQQISEKLERNLSELSEGKVSRSDLAELLFELCIKIKGADLVPELPEAATNEISTDLILPEKK
jgi:SMC interacting uncharacterized protein involved in chromosome segregation